MAATTNGEVGRSDVQDAVGAASAAAVARAPDLLHCVQRMPPIPNAESLQLAFTPKYVKESPETVQKFIRATLRGIAWIKANGNQKTAELVSKK